MSDDLPDAWLAEDPLWLRVRGAALNPGSSRRRVVEARVILNWALPDL